MNTRDDWQPFFDAAHAQLAEFARASYAAEGRGVTFVRAPGASDLPSGWVITDMVYHTLPAMRELFKNDVKNRENVAITLRMMETYDPATHAVVMAVRPTGNPVTAKMRLDAPLVLDEAAGVH